MKVTIEFEDDERTEAAHAINARHYAWDLMKLDEACRSKLKHEELKEGQYEILEWVRDMIADAVSLYHEEL